MAKIIISIEDGISESVSIDISGDFEKDIAKCSSAQRIALEGIMFMMRDVKTENKGCDKECGGCEKEC